MEILNEMERILHYNNSLSVQSNTQYIFPHDKCNNNENNNSNNGNNDTNTIISNITNRSIFHLTNNADIILSWGNICLIAVFCTFIVITIIGNTLVILAVITTRRLKTVTNYFVLSLSVADLLVGIFVMPPAVAVHLSGSWQLGWMLCDVWISLDVLLCTASILNLSAISIDRYLAVTRPLTYSRKRRSKHLALIMILIVWLLALAVTCPPMLGWYEPGRRDLNECRYNQNKGYVVYSAMGSFFIPMMVMIYVYARIAYVVAKRHNDIIDLTEQTMARDKQITHPLTCNDIDQDLSENTCKARKDDPQIVVTQCSKKGGGKMITNSDDKDERNSKKTHRVRLHSGEKTNTGSVQKKIESNKYCKCSGSEHSNCSVFTKIFKFHSCNNLDNISSLNVTSKLSQLSVNRHATSVNRQYQQQGGHALYTMNNVPNISSTCIPLILRQSTQTITVNNSSSKYFSNRISTLKKEHKTTQTLSIVVGGFIACWLPFFINYLITPFSVEYKVNSTAVKALTWLGWFNSALNPFIYAFYSVDFRIAFWRLTCKPFISNTNRKFTYNSNTASTKR